MLVFSVQPVGDTRSLQYALGAIAPINRADDITSTKPSECMSTRGHTFFLSIVSDRSVANGVFLVSLPFACSPGPPVHRVVGWKHFLAIHAIKFASPAVIFSCACVISLCLRSRRLLFHAVAVSVYLLVLTDNAGLSNSPSPNDSWEHVSRVR